MGSGLPDIRTLFLVWAPPTHGSSRSREFAKELGIEDLHYIFLSLPQGALTAPLRYIYQAVQTFRLLFAKRPKVVFIQSPPSFAVFFIFIYCKITSSHYIVDAHSGAFDIPIWTYPKWLYHILARQALATIVTDEYYQQRIMDWGGKAIVLKDPITTYPSKAFPLKGRFNLVVVNTFSNDEPLEEVLEATADLSEIEFYITGKKSVADERILMKAPANVHFTDYLPAELYYGLLSSSDAIMCLTTQDHTLQCGACEALSLGKPIITSNWPILREYFNRGTVHVPNTPEGIRLGVMAMLQNYDHFLREIKELQAHQRKEWRTQVEQLIHLIEQSTSSGTGYRVG